jgi:asparagine synthase (glutamine-hydrolysing)
MPGIAGIISNKNPEICGSEIKKMIGCMMHESFYIANYYTNEQLGVYAGVVSHKESFSDCMPVFNETKDIVILFSGENFADEDLTNRLRGRGHSFNPLSAEYLVHLYEEDEDQFLAQLNGWFSGMIVDLRKSEVSIFNDRYGMGRIYCHEYKGELLFSSEAKSLLKVEPSLRKFNLESLGEIFCCGCTLQNKSLFEGVTILPGGSVWTFKKGSCVSKNQYFTPSMWENQPVLEREVFYQELKKTFSRVLPRYLRSTKPLAMSVTGGLDTRMILACADSSHSFPCYTFGGIYRDCLDVTIGHEVADACNREHEVIRLDTQFFEKFPKYAEKTIYITEGYHDVVGAHDIFLNEKAREIAPVRLTGLFGGEILRGVATINAAPPARELFNPDFYEYILKASSTVADNRKGRPLSYSLFRGIPWNMYGCLSAEQSQINYRSPYMDNDLVKLVYQAPADVIYNNEISLRLIEDYNPRLAQIMSDRGFYSRRTPLLSNLKELFYWSLFRLDWYYGVGMPGWAGKLESKWALNQLRKLFLGAQRIDHYRMWFQKEFAEYIRETLLERRTKGRPYLNERYLERVGEGHISGAKNYLGEINRLLTVELIERLLMGGIWDGLEHSLLEKIE